MTILLLGTMAPSHGLPTDCPVGLAVYCYLKLAGIPFNLIHQHHQTSDMLPYVAFEEFIAFGPDIIETLKQARRANLDYWITPDSEQDIRLGMHQIQLRMPEREHEILQLYPHLARIFSGKAVLKGTRPTSLDACFLGHALYVLHALQGTNLEMSLLLDTPREFHYYQIQYFFSKGKETLGAGSFGEVFKCWIIGSDTNSPGAMPIAIKQSHNLRARDEKREYEHEISHLQKLRHPNIIQLLGYAQHGKLHFLIYELMPNGSVSQNLDAIDWESATKVALGSAEAMMYLHNRVPPIIFPDFKSANIVLDKDFNPKLTDFGIAEEEGKIAHGETLGFTDKDTLLNGTRLKATDIFSMGTLLIQLITKETETLQKETPEYWRCQLKNKHNSSPEFIGIKMLPVKCTKAGTSSPTVY